MLSWEMYLKNNNNNGQIKAEIKSRDSRGDSGPHQVFIDEHGQLSEGRVADFMLPMDLKASKNTGKEPGNCFRKEITSYDLKRGRADV